MTDIKKEGDGGGFGDSGGTAFTSTDAGIFTPTYSDRGKRKKNNEKKRTGVDRLADFITDNSPERKMQKAEDLIAVTELIKWVTVELRKGDKHFRQQTGGENMSNLTPRIEWTKGNKELPKENSYSEFDAHPSTQTDVDQNAETDRIKQLDDEDNANNTPTQSLNVKLAMPSAAVQYDSLGQGGSKDTKRYGEIEGEPDYEGTEVEEDEPENEINKLLNLLDKQ